MTQTTMSELSLPSMMGFISLLIIVICKGAPELEHKQIEIYKDSSAFDSKFSHELIPVESKDNLSGHLISGDKIVRKISKAREHFLVGVHDWHTLFSDWHTEKSY